MINERVLKNWATVADYWYDIVQDCAERYDDDERWRMYKRYDKMVQQMYAALNKIKKTKGTDNGKA